MIGSLRQLVRALLPKRRGRQLLVVAHSLQFEQEELDLEFGFVLDGEAPIFLPAGSGLALSPLPAVERMAVCVRAGPPGTVRKPRGPEIELTDLVTQAPSHGLRAIIDIWRLSRRAGLSTLTPFDRCPIAKIGTGEARRNRERKGRGSVALPLT